MQDIKLQVIGLIGVLALGTFLYFHKLDSIPNGLYVDEASTGYNAYSILKTGKDEYGKSFPIAMRFLGSYSPPLYTYLTTGIVYLRGLQVSSVRFISAISGVLSIVTYFYLLKSLKVTKSSHSQILGTVFFAISPWLIFYSRAGYELNLDFLFFSLYAFTFWLSLKKPKLLIPALILISLSTYAGHTQKILAPIFFLIVMLVFKKEFLSSRSRKYLFLGILSAAIIQIPHLTILATPAFFSKTSLFYIDVVYAQAEKISNLLPNFIAIPASAVREFLSQYLTYFSPRSLFFLPDPDPQRSIPELSVFYPWMIIPYILGLYIIWKNKKSAAYKFIFILTLISPFPAALTSDPFSTQRALPLLLPLSLINTIGLEKLINKIKFYIWVPIVFVLILLSLLLFWRSYFVLLPNERAKNWGYGFKELAEEIKKRPTENFIIDQSRIKPAYIELAFYLEYPPEKFQQETDKSIAKNYYTNVDFSDAYKFANIETRNINWEYDIYREQILVGDELAVSESQAQEHFLEKVFEIRDSIGAIIFQGYKTNPKIKCRHTQNLSPFCSSP